MNTTERLHLEGLHIIYRLCPDFPAEIVDRARTRYNDRDSPYHNWSHIMACFAALAEIEPRWVHPANSPPDGDGDGSHRYRPLILAILFHDVCYEPFSTWDEERSAGCLVAEGLRARLPLDELMHAVRLVMQTKHDGPPTLDAAPFVDVMVDVDLSILGTKPEVFDKYEQQIRQEYIVVEDGDYAEGRHRVFQRFLDRPNIFQTPLGQTLWERSARANIKRSLARLQALADTAQADV
jgi:predicted metal-dependent HD superfamily phosphohydrolase